MTQQNRVSGRSTSVYTSDGWTRVIYHQTEVVKWNINEIILDTGGWRTVTTKTRMNQASNQFKLGFRVWQDDGEWYVDYRDTQVTMQADTLILCRQGEKAFVDWRE